MALSLDGFGSIVSDLGLPVVNKMTRLVILTRDRPEPDTDIPCASGWVYQCDDAKKEGK